MLRHNVRIHVVEGPDELGPVGHVVSLAQRDEVPRRILRPFVGPLAAAEVDARLVRGQPSETVVQDTVQPGVLGIDPDVLRRGVEDQRPELTNHGHRVGLLPEQV